MKHTHQSMSKSAILRKTFVVGGLTLASRIVAVAREALQVRFLGVGVVSDAFIAAFRIPNLFRHVFAEGALGASFIPVIVQTIRDKQWAVAASLMSISLLILQGCIALLYLGILLFPTGVVSFIAPGFGDQQVVYAAYFLKLLFPFLFLASASALLAGALNAAHHFFMPACGPVLWNIVYVATLWFCLSYHLSPVYLCLGILLGGIIQLIGHIAVYRAYGLHFGGWTLPGWHAFKQVLAKFFPCLFGVSIVEVNLFVSGQIASCLAAGSVSLLYYASRFMNLPLGIFAVALSNILLPHFSRITLHAPKRLHFYLTESTKFVAWVIVPISLLMVFCAEQLFVMLLGLSGASHPEYILIATRLLQIYCCALPFLSLNKILLSMFYSLKDTRSAALISCLGALVNIVGDLISLYTIGIYGIALSGVVSSLTMTVACFVLLHLRHHISGNMIHYMNFVSRFSVQVAGCAILFGGGFYLASSWSVTLCGMTFVLCSGLGFWFFTACLAGLSAGWLVLSQYLFGAKIYFLKF